MALRHNAFLFQLHSLTRFSRVVFLVYHLVCTANAVDAQSDSSSKTAAEKFQSVIVLSDLPADHMGKVMNMMSASLGVNCSFCHEGTNFSKEGAGQKEAARKMIEMTRKLNKDFFGGRTEVTCNTCHRGKAKPTSSIDLAPGIRPLDRSNLPQNSLTANEIMAKHIQAIGGAKKLESFRSRHVVAKRHEPHGGSEPEEIWQTSTGLTKMLTQYGKVAVIEGFDGSQAWKTVNGNRIELKPDESEQIRLEATIAFGNAIPDAYSELRVDSTARIDDRDVIVLSGLNQLKLSERLYFDSQSGLLRRRISTVPTMLGAFEYQVDYEKYRDFGGVLQPAEIRFAVPNITWTREVTQIEMNVEIDNSIFRSR